MSTSGRIRRCTGTCRAGSSSSAATRRSPGTPASMPCRVQVAVHYRIPLVFYAEHGESEYGGRVLSEESKKIRNLTEVIEHQIGDDPRNWVDDEIERGRLESVSLSRRQRGGSRRRAGVLLRVFLPLEHVRELRIPAVEDSVCHASRRPHARHVHRLRQPRRQVGRPVLLHAIHQIRVRPRGPRRAAA